MLDSGVLEPNVIVVEQGGTRLLVASTGQQAVLVEVQRAPLVQVPSTKASQEHEEERRYQNADRLGRRPVCAGLQ